jgi:hypothetical protein
VTFSEAETTPSGPIATTRLRRQLAEQAISQATAADWSDAAESNRKILELGADAEA